MNPYVAFILVVLGIIIYSFLKIKRDEIKESMNQKSFNNFNQSNMDTINNFKNIKNEILTDGLWEITEEDQGYFYFSSKLSSISSICKLKFYLQGNKIRVVIMFRGSTGIHEIENFFSVNTNTKEIFKDCNKYIINYIKKNYPWSSFNGTKVI